jgi:DNA-binding MarR family transcriptional regulator
VGCCRFRDTGLNAVLKDFDLNVEGFRVLAMLHHFGPTAMTEGAEFTCIERTTLTRMVERLAARGLIRRTTAREDRRKVMLDLTDAGEDLYFAGLHEIKCSNIVMLSGVSEAEQRATARVLRTLVAAVAPSEAARDAMIDLSRGPNPPESAVRPSP